MPSGLSWPQKKRKLATSSILREVKYVEIGQRAQLRSAEIDLQEAQVELKRAEANADRMLLKAPIDGLVVMQTTFRGSEFAQIQPGDQLFPGMMFMQIVDPSSMIINATVNQVDVESLKIGAKATVRFDAYPGLGTARACLLGRAMTRPGGLRGSFVKEIPVVLKLDKIDPRVIPDLSVSCDVVIEQEEETTVAPLSAVFKDDSGIARAFPCVRAEWLGMGEAPRLSWASAITLRCPFAPGCSPAKWSPQNYLRWRSRRSKASSSTPSRPAQPCAGARVG